MARPTSRREFIRSLGIGAAAMPFVCNLPSLGFANTQGRKQRLVMMFSPNGVVLPNFWPDEEGEQFRAQRDPQAAGSLSGSDAHSARRVRQGPRRRRQPHARHGLSADRHRTVSRQHPGRLAHAGRLGQRHFDRSGNQELSAEPTPRRARVSARWNSAWSCPSGPTPGRAWFTPVPTSRSPRSTIRTRCSPSCTVG